MKVLVCGGRYYNDHESVRNQLGYLSPTLVIHGGASGADSLADEWARRNHVHCARVDALWDAFGPSAGPRRNQAMLSLGPDVVLAFPGGRGTEDMVDRATKAGVTVVRISTLGAVVK